MLKKPYILKATIFLSFSNAWGTEQSLGTLPPGLFQRWSGVSGGWQKGSVLKERTLQQERRAEGREDLGMDRKSCTLIEHVVKLSKAHTSEALT